MISMDCPYSLEDIERNAQLYKVHTLIAMVQHATESYNNFMQLVRLRLDSAIEAMQKNSNVINFDLSEDQLTLYLIAYIQSTEMGIEAAHEVNERGHCDITVKFFKYTWHGEAKKHKTSYSYLFKGYSQLTERYSYCSNNSQSGGVIIYLSRPNTASIMSKWQAHLDKYAPKTLKQNAFTSSFCPKNQNVLLSQHLHTVSGLKYDVIHYPVNFYYNPKDREM
ncbi:hypothetical protein [Providencia manganoxydans]|uniref:hypothetical protein n=1 Tax=Providencia manganoxydans TaxID=2923283 RepID=UPI0034E46C3B